MSDRDRQRKHEQENTVSGSLYARVLLRCRPERGFAFDPVANRIVYCRFRDCEMDSQKEKC